MEDIKIGTKVNIKLTRVDGRVIGLWENENGMQYLIEYGDVSKVVHEHWFFSNDFTVV